MAHPSNRGRRRKSPQEKVEKANQDTNISSERNLNPATTRMRLGAYSIPSLSTVQGQIYEQARRELRFPQSTKIFKQMSLDANIAAAIALIEAMIGKIDWEMKVKPDASQEEKDRAEKLNYNMLTMDRPWQEYIIEALSILVYGFHVPEKIYKKIDDSPVGSFVGLKDLRTISQDTVDKWIFSNTTGDLVGLRQDLSRLTGGTQLVSRTERSQQDIPRKKFILFRHNPKRNNPEGHSPLLGPYLSWKYKSIVEEAETISAAKGLGGILDIGIEASYLSKAQADPSGPEAKAVEELKLQGANFHNGDQGFVLTPVAYDDRGKELFYTKILETKPVETEGIVKRHDNRILMTFFSTVLSMGSEGGGSFALSDNQLSLLRVGIESILENLTRTFNHDLIPQIYELNGWDYDPRSSVQLSTKGIEEKDLEIFSKAVQRVVSVGAVDPTEDIEDTIREHIFELGPKSEANTKIRETAVNNSRSGDGLEEGMPNGTGSGTSDRDSSTDNTENA